VAARPQQRRDRQRGREHHALARLRKLPLKALIDSGFFQQIERQRLCLVIPGWECAHQERRPRLR
jgi:hypothetical protein